MSYRLWTLLTVSCAELWVDQSFFLMSTQRQCCCFTLYFQIPTETLTIMVCSQFFASCFACHSCRRIICVYWRNNANNIMQINTNIHSYIGWSSNISTWAKDMNLSIFRLISSWEECEECALRFMWIISPANYHRAYVATKRGDRIHFASY